MDGFALVNSIEMSPRVLPQSLLTVEATHAVPEDDSLISTTEKHWKSRLLHSVNFALLQHRTMP